MESPWPGQNSDEPGRTSRRTVGGSRAPSDLALALGVRVLVDGRGVLRGLAGTHHRVLGRRARTCGPEGLAPLPAEGRAAEELAAFGNEQQSVREFLRVPIEMPLQVPGNARKRFPASDFALPGARRPVVNSNPHTQVVEVRIRAPHGCLFPALYSGRRRLLVLVVLGGAAGRAPGCRNAPGAGPCPVRMSRDTRTDRGHLTPGSEYATPHAGLVRCLISPRAWKLGHGRHEPEAWDNGGKPWNLLTQHIDPQR